MFEDASKFSFVSLLEREWQIIRDEALQVDFTRYFDWPEKFLYESGWRVFGLHAWGYPLAGNVELCPRTASVVSRIPGLVTAGFSSLDPGTYIKPHHGLTSAVLRCHLGLQVPAEGRCELRVGAETRRWEQGRCFVFDDTQEHEAWNQTSERRIVLLLDFKRHPDGPDVAVPDYLRQSLGSQLPGQ